MNKEIIPTSKRIYEKKRTFIGTEEDAKKYINVLDKHYILDIFFEDYNRTYPIPTQSWEKIVKLMPEPMKYALKYVIFSVTRQNKNYIYVSESRNITRNETFETALKPAPKAAKLNTDASVFNNFKKFMSK